jgi:hypothetical protein
VLSFSSNTLSMPAEQVSSFQISSAISALSCSS